ncbi:hypothetical protein ACHAWF_017901 [Thalassiosira exigua]
MKFFTSLVASLAVSVASGSFLRGDFEADVVEASSRILQNCVARSSYLGCFQNRNNNRALPHEVDGRGHTAEECESACTDMGFMFFALEYKGQCFCSNNSDYDKHGSSSGCDCCGDNVGAHKMCVWSMGGAAGGCEGNGAPSAPYLGCFNNRNLDRALPHEVSGRNHSAKDCQDECGKKEMKYFSREWKGQCFCGNDDDYNKHGVSSNCNCCGSNVGSHKMCVWQGS